MQDVEPTVEEWKSYIEDASVKAKKDMYFYEAYLGLTTFNEITCKNIGSASKDLLQDLWPKVEKLPLGPEFELAVNNFISDKNSNKRKQKGTTGEGMKCNLSCLNHG